MSFIFFLSVCIRIVQYTYIVYLQCMLDLEYEQKKVTMQLMSLGSFVPFFLYYYSTISFWVFFCKEEQAACSEHETILYYNIIRRLFQAFPMTQEYFFLDQTLLPHNNYSQPVYHYVFAPNRFKPCHFPSRKEAQMPPCFFFSKVKSFHLKIGVKQKRNIPT